MAAVSVTDSLTPRQRRGSMELLPPLLSVVLVGNSSSERREVENFILGRTEFTREEEVRRCESVTGKWRERELVVINTPDLLHPDISEEELREHGAECERLTGPGPHVFLLVLQPEDFTKQQNLKLREVLQLMGDGSLDQSMVLITKKRRKSSGGNFMTSPPLTALIRRCGDRYLRQENLDHEELLTRLSQTLTQAQIRKNVQPEKDVTEKLFELKVKSKGQISDLIPRLGDRSLRQENLDQEELHNKNQPSNTEETFTQAQTRKNDQQEKHVTELQKSQIKGQSLGAAEKPNIESLRIVLIGKTGCGKSSSGNTILGLQEFKSDLSQKSITKLCQKSRGEVDGRPVFVVDTPGLFDDTLSHEEINEELKSCISLVAPGPHVFLLVVPIGRFTPEDKETLELIKQVFENKSEDFTIVLLTRGDELSQNNLSITEFVDEKCDDSFKKLIRDCGERFHVFNNRDCNNPRQVRELINKIDSMVKGNGGSFFTNKMLQEAEAAIQKEIKRILSENKDLRREMERKDKTLKEHKETLEKHEETVREQAEEFNEFKKKNNEKLEALAALYHDLKNKRRCTIS